MKNSFKNVIDLPEIIDTNTPIEEAEQLKYDKLLKNYKELVIININNVERVINTEKNKAFIIYSFGLSLELFLKMILLKYITSDIKRVSSYSHNILEMLNVIIKSNQIHIKRYCEEINDYLSKIKIANRNIDYKKYTDYRYNHKSDSMDLMCEEEINDKDKNSIKEVLNCIRQVMECL